MLQPGCVYLSPRVRDPAGGVSGSLPILGVGTAMFIVHNVHQQPHIILLRNCLLSPGDSFNLVSVSQLQASGQNSVNFHHDSPTLSLTSGPGHLLLPLTLSDGLFSFSAQPFHINDERYTTLPRFHLTAKGPYVPPASTLDSSNSWNYTLIVAPSSTRRVVAYPAAIGPEFDAALRQFCTTFIAPTAIPPARRTYDSANPLHMADLSIRWMGVGDERLQRTLALNHGLTPTTGRVPTLNFPQGKFVQGQTPKVRKDKVHHLHRASICEVVFTDTFETDDYHYRYGQAYVDYRSRYGDIIPLRSRKQVGWSFGEFCCRNFTPLILIRDNIAENKGGDLLLECHRWGVQSAYICPYTPQQDQAENYLGRIPTMASYAMVYSGAPLFFWRWATQAATFVDRLTATYYSREKVWSTPYTLLFNEPFPDASIIVPFGCAALVLLQKDDREKFRSRCTIMIFLHYATSHPIYTYAFYSPLTKQVVYRQDCIFLVTTFPMREARTRAGSSVSGDSFVPFRLFISSVPPTNEYLARLFTDKYLARLFTNERNCPRIV
jgi:hypothetical protein